METLQCNALLPSLSLSLSMQVLSPSISQLAAPTLLSRDATSVTVQWTPPETETEGYRLRYRAEDSLEWTYVDTVLQNTQVKKKGLAAGVNYYFSVLPVILPASSSSSSRDTQDESSPSSSPSPSSSSSSVFQADAVTSSASSISLFEFSPQSLPYQVQQCSAYISKLFPDQLVAQDGSKRDTAGE